MTVIRNNSISGINSITAQSTNVSFYDSSGSALKLSAGDILVGTGASVYSPTTNALALGTNNAERVRINSSGSVGIGTDNASRKLHIHESSATNTYLQLSNSTTGSGTDDGFQIVCTGSTGQVSLIQRENQPLTFQTNNQERLRINSSGDVGINDDSPTQSGNGNDPVLSFKGRGSSYAGRIDFKDSSGNLDAIVRSDNGVLLLDADPSNVTGNSAITFSTDGGERLRIDSSGNIGIGTDNPAAMVEIKKTTNNAQLRVTSSYEAALWLVNGGGSEVNVINSGGSGNLSFRVSNSEKFRMTSGGNLQIGNGNLVFSTAGTGIDFSATGEGSGTMTSELLDDYEEGTFTPSFTGGTSGSGYTRQVGEYTKVGRLVTFTLTIDGDGGLTGTATAIEIGGLPFTSRNVAELGGAQYSYPGNFDTTNDRRLWLVAQNNTRLSYRDSSAQNINGNAVNNINSQFALYGHYYTDS